LPDEAPQKDEQEWWTSLLDYEDRFTLEDLIPDEEAPEAWDQLEAAEERDRLLSLLRELPTAQRRAFLLHTLENYATDEIAMLQDRPESEVKADIEAARKTLRDRLLAAGHVPRTRQPATAAGTAPEKGRKD
jgi:RNA polymerase sigma factor (sigma-70 family)